VEDPHAIIIAMQPSSSARTPQVSECAYVGRCAAP
jgi:hypothetical protein